MITFSDLAVSNDETVDADFFNRRYNLIVSAVAEAMAAATMYGTVSTQLLQVGLDRVDGVLGPLLIRLSSAAELGFLIAGSPTLQTLSVGNQGDFIITSDTQRELFTPTPWLTVIDNTDDQNYAILQLINWNKTTGVLQTNVMYVHGGTTISSEDWTLACASAVLPAMADMLNQAQVASSEAQAANAGVQDALDDLQAAIAAIQEGPVSSVAGHTGAVVLALADTVGLVAALAGKLNAASNLADVPNATTARANLGLGTAALASATSFVQSAQNLNDLASLSQARINIGAAAAAIQINAGTGLAGGGDLTANRTLSYNIPGLTVKALPSSADDYVIIYDAAASATKRATIGSFSPFAVGTVFTSFNSPGSDWISLNGASYTQAAKPSLYAVIGNLYNDVSDFTSMTTAGTLTNPFLGIYWDGAQFIAFGSTGTFTAPTDGQTWTLRDSSAANYVAVANNGATMHVAISSAGICRKSVNGAVTWTGATAITQSSMQDMAFGQGLFVAVSSNTTGSQIFTCPSQDSAWTTRTNPFTGVGLASVAFGNGVFIATATSARTSVLYSTDGQTWTSQSVPSGSHRVRFLSSIGKFVLVSAAVTLLSSDGITWDTVTTGVSTLEQTPVLAVSFGGMLVWATTGVTKLTYDLIKLHTSAVALTLTGLQALTTNPKCCAGSPTGVICALPTIPVSNLGIKRAAIDLDMTTLFRVPRSVGDVPGWIKAT